MYAHVARTLQTVERARNGNGDSVTAIGGVSRKSVHGRVSNSWKTRETFVCKPGEQNRGHEVDLAGIRLGVGIGWSIETTGVRHHQAQREREGEGEGEGEREMLGVMQVPAARRDTVMREERKWTRSGGGGPQERNRWK